MKHARMNCHHTPQVQAMSRARAQAGDTPRQARAKVRWMGVAAALCLSAWIALGAGIVGFALGNLRGRAKSREEAAAAAPAPVKPSGDEPVPATE